MPYTEAWVKAGGKLEEAPVLVKSPPHIKKSGEIDGAIRKSWPVPCEWQEEEFQNWSSMKVQGVRVTGFKGSKESKPWIQNILHLPVKSYSQALQLRAGVFFTRKCSARGQSKRNASCRGCSYKLESCSHVLRHCRMVQGKRMLRQNNLCVRIGSVARRKE